MKLQITLYNRVDQILPVQVAVLMIVVMEIAMSDQIVGGTAIKTQQFVMKEASATVIDTLKKDLKNHQMKQQIIKKLQTNQIVRTLRKRIKMHQDKEKKLQLEVKKEK